MLEEVLTLSLSKMGLELGFKPTLNERTHAVVGTSIHTMRGLPGSLPASIGSPVFKCLKGTCAVGSN